MNKIIRLSIVYDRNLKEVHGVNKVTEVMIQSYDIFKLHNIELEYFISSKQIIVCKKYKDSLIGLAIAKKSNIFSNSIKKVKKIIKKTILNTFLGNLIEVYLKILLPSKNSVIKYNNLEQPADILIFQAMHSLYYFKKNINNKEKTILILHCMDDPLEQFLNIYTHLKNTWFEKKMRNRLEYLFNVSDKIIFVAKKASDVLKAKYPEYNSKIAYIHNGILDTKHLKKESDNYKLKCVIVGTVTYRKGHDIIVDAIKMLKKDDLNNIEINIIGDGPELEEIKTKIDKYNLSESFIFWGNRNNVVEILPEMDIFLLPSRDEGLPISIIEAFRTGIPVIATNVGGIPEILKDEYNGFIIEPKPTELYTLFIRILKSRSILSSYGKNARKTYEEYFNDKKMIEEYAKIINTL